MTRYQTLNDAEYVMTETTLKKLTMLAHQAVLFEKIKQKINEQEGQKLEALADILVGKPGILEPQSELDKWGDESDEDFMGGDEE